MGKTRHITLAALFGAFTAMVAMVTQIIVTAIMGTAVTSETLVAAAIGGAAVFVVSFLTVLFVWPRIGYEPFDSHTHETTSRNDLRMCCNNGRLSQRELPEDAQQCLQTGALMTAVGWSRPRPTIAG